ncbi:MAG: hypothetical protein BWY10_02408 [Chloroflexi bacterium ADurb.Bin180]|nr:MAG: hypothetical protein BWY10_02408 [Chloroflexi bacterium ADurb.Bin180]
MSPTLGSTVGFPSIFLVRASLCGGSSMSRQAEAWTSGGCAPLAVSQRSAARSQMSWPAFLARKVRVCVTTPPGGIGPGISQSAPPTQVPSACCHTLCAVSSGDADWYCM